LVTIIIIQDIINDGYMQLHIQDQSTYLIGQTWLTLIGLLIKHLLSPITPCDLTNY